VENIAGVVPVGSFGLAQFSSGRSGEYSITLVSLNPPASVFVEVSLGVLDQGVCRLTGPRNPQVARGQVALQGPIQQGTYCVFVFDQVPPVLSVDTTFTLSVSHP
jgi:hypothetical protein